MTEDEMVGWHHRLDGHGFEQPPGDGEGHGEALACCSLWGPNGWTEQNQIWRTLKHGCKLRRKAMVHG